MVNVHSELTYYTDYGSNVPMIEHTIHDDDDVNDQELEMKV